MFRHVVLFRLHADATVVQRQNMLDALSALPDQINQVRDYRIGPDAGLADGNFDFAVTADFDNQADYEIYRDHPAHQHAVTECVRPIAEQRVAVQYHC